MTQEMVYIVSTASVLFAIWSGIMSFRRGERQDNKSATAELTTVIVKLENIGTGVSEIKSEMSSMRNDVKDTREKLIEVESSVRNAHERLDRCEKECKLVKDSHLS